MRIFGALCCILFRRRAFSRFVIVKTFITAAPLFFPDDFGRHDRRPDDGVSVPISARVLKRSRLARAGRRFGKCFKGQ
jgi:hypothetical protein